MSLKVSRILHAGYIFEFNETKIIFDPIFENPFSRNCYAYPEIQFKVEEIRKLQLDAIFISHVHDDHCSLDSLNLLDRETPVFIFCLLDEIPELIRQIGFKSVYQLRLNQAIQVGPFKMTPRRALDYDVDCLFQIQVENFNILNVVDSWIDWETIDLLKNEKPWDLILWPFQTMRELEVLSPRHFGFPPPEIPAEWIEQLEMLQPKALVPSSCQFIQESWSWYHSAYFPISYQFFEAKIKEVLPSVTVYRLNPGCSLERSDEKFKSSESLAWIIPIGNQNIDYSYQADLKIPSAAEVAKNFPALSEDQQKVVDIFLTQEALKIFNSLEPLESPYFDHPRRWELRTFSSNGQDKKYIFEIQNQRIEILSPDASKKFDWLTEISDYKVFSALTSGESLSSLYIRINDFESWEGFEQTDATMDPLVRCLFSKNPASYQIAQFQRLSQLN